MVNRHVTSRRFCFSACVKTRQIPGVVPRLKLGRNSADRTMSNVHGKAPGSSTPELRAQAGAELAAWG